jgi:hypothetical protein
MAKDSVFNPSYIGNENLRWLSEAKREIGVKNNVYYWPQAVTDHTATSIKKNSDVVSVNFELYNAYPNLFNPLTTIKFNLANSSNVSLKIYNVNGQLVKTLIDNNELNKGQYKFNVNMDNYSSSTYFYVYNKVEKH